MSAKLIKFGALFREGSEGNMETISFSTCTKEFLKENFRLQQLWESPLLEQWFERAQSGVGQL